MEQIDARAFNIKLRSARGSRGFVLLMTLIVLVILTLSSLAMMRLMGAGATTAGNVAFRQAAVRGGDLGIEGARAWLLAQSAVALQSDSPANGYYAANDPTFTPQNFNFTNAAAAKQYISGGVSSFSGYQIYYVIHRMAVTAGVACSDPTAGCVIPPAASTGVTGAGSSHLAGSGYQGSITGSTGLVYYRITAKVAGPRFNNRYVQAFVY